MPFNPDYVVATWPGHDRKTFWVLSVLLAIVIGVVASLIIKPVFAALFPDSPLIFVNDLTIYLLCGASIYSACRYCSRVRLAYYTRFDYLLSAKKSVLAILKMSIWMFIGLIAIVLFIVAAIFFIVAKSMKNVFGR